MNPKVLIIFPYSNHNEMVKNMVQSLRTNGVVADAFNTSQFSFVLEPIVSFTGWVKYTMTLLSLMPSKLRFVLFRFIIFKLLLLKICENYDIVDFHVFHRGVDSLINKLLRHKTVKITIWGSDFYRADIARREQHRKIYAQCNCIQLVTESFKQDFLNYFQDFETKIRISNFGLYQFDIIDKVNKAPNKPLFKFGQYKDKIMVACGYNGSKGQQHKLIIAALKRIENRIKDKIYLVFPMTYGADLNYLHEVQKELEVINIPYTVVDKHLDNEEIARLRIETDLAVNIQITDAFSGSLQEHIFCENLLLVGDWLPYSLLDVKGIFYKKCSLDNLSLDILDCIENFSFYKKKTFGNKEKIHNISSWNVAGPRMSMIYKEMCL